MSSSRRGLNPKTTVLLVFVGVFVLACWGVWAASPVGRAPGELQEELKAAKADGLPMTAAELQVGPPVRDDENAASLLKAAFIELKTWQGSDDGKKLQKAMRSNGVSSLRDEEIEQYRPLVADAGNLISNLKQAAKRPKLDYHRPWDQGPSLLFKELPDERACLSPLLLKAKLDLKDGKTASAMEMIDTASKISALASQEPCIISLLVGAGMRSQISKVIADAIKAHPEDATLRSGCRLALKDMGPQPDVRPAVRSEFLMGHIAVGMMANSKEDLFGSDGSGNAVGRLARFGPVRTVYDLRFTQTYHELYRNLGKKPESIKAMHQVFFKEQEAIDRRSNRDWTYGLADMLAPVFTGMADALGETEAKRNVLLTGLALLEAKQKTGAFPAALPSAASSIDPFTDRPLIYRREKSGFIVYSVARNGKDDGGKPKTPKLMDDKYDIPFAFP